MSDASEPEAQQTPLPPLRSVHTTSFPAILDELGVSVLVTTYQAGKLVMLRPDGEVLNTHFCRFNKPMGLGCIRVSAPGPSRYDAPESASGWPDRPEDGHE